MANNVFKITLTEKGAGSGPQYTVYYDTGSSGAYTPVLTGNPVTLANVGDYVYMIVDNQATSFKLSDYPGGPCDTCSTSSIATVPAPPSPTPLCFCYYVYNSTSGSLTASWTNCANVATSSIVPSAQFAYLCAANGSTPTGAGLTFGACGSSCSGESQCTNCGENNIVDGWAVAQCSGSTTYKVTFNTTSSIAVGTVFSGSGALTGCWNVTAAFRGAVDYSNVVLFNTYETCYNCSYEPPPYRWYASSNYSTAFDACIGQFPNQILWSNSASLVNTQTYMYTDPGLTTPYNGLFNSYSRTGVPADGTWAAAETDVNGMITGVTPC
jgi:hypothetical protein